ncbi:MAG: hypothetical protein OSB03_11070 [Vicinamibacterales bacterium]|nr:hypothetical protein [Vicinamibacterales bacterium]
MFAVNPTIYIGLGRLLRPTRASASAIVAVLTGLASACGGGSPPTAPSPLDGPVGRAAAVHGMGSAVTISAFATASDAPTLKVTAPTPSAPMNDVVVPSLDPTLSVTMSTGEYVQAPGLQLGFAL